MMKLFSKLWTICWLVRLKLSRSQLYFRFRAERHTVNNYRPVMLSALFFSFAFFFNPAEVIFSSKSSKESAEKMFPFKVYLALFSSQAIILRFFA